MRVPKKPDGTSYTVEDVCGMPIRNYIKKAYGKADTWKKRMDAMFLEHDVVCVYESETDGEITKSCRNAEILEIAWVHRYEL